MASNFMKTNIHSLPFSVFLLSFFVNASLGAENFWAVCFAWPHMPSQVMR